MRNKVRLSDHDHQVVVINRNARDMRVRCIYMQRGTSNATGYVMFNNQKVPVETHNYHAGIWRES